MFVADDLGAWLVGLLADAGRRKLTTLLLGSDQDRALRLAVAAAIRDATAEGARSGQEREQIVLVIGEVFREPMSGTPMAGVETVLEGLRRGIAGQLAVLDDPGLTSTGYSAADTLGVSGAVLAERLASHLVRNILRSGARGGPLTPLADQLNHELTRLQVQRVEGSLARLTDVIQKTPIPAEGASVPGQPLTRVSDPFALEVHRPIRPDKPMPGLAALPAYVLRKHDGALAEVIQSAAAGSSAIVLLVGGSSTGKTRACWEALHLLRGLREQWRLWHPISPAPVQAIIEGLDDVGPHTVIWLNEAQRYLRTPDSLGERVASGLRELLRDPVRGPVLVLGSIWPEYWDILTAVPDTGALADPHQQARELLKNGITVHVPAAFTGPALDRVRAAAADDARLALAVSQAGDGRVTQFLAGAPALMERFHNAPAVPRALIEATMDARRLGHGPELPGSLLEAAVAGYLGDHEQQRLDGDWLDKALAYAGADCRGVPGPVTRIGAKPGEAAFSEPHYRLADYLEQVGRTARRNMSAPAALWEALIDHAASSSLLRLAVEAGQRGLYRYKLGLNAAAASVTGESHAWMLVAQQLETVGTLELTIEAYQHAAEAGDATAVTSAGRLLEKAGRIEEALDHYRRAAEAGDATAVTAAGRLLERAARTEEAIDCYRRAGETGDGHGWMEAADLLARAGRIDEAIAAYQQSAQAGWQVSWPNAANLLRRTRGTDQAISWLLAQASADAASVAAKLLEEDGRFEEAVAVCLAAADADGGEAAMWQAGRLLRRAGCIDRALIIYQHAGEVYGVNHWYAAAATLREAGRIEGALQAYGNVLRTGSRNWRSARCASASLLKAAGLIREALAAYQDAADGGDCWAALYAGDMLAGAARNDEAVAAYRRADELGIAFAAFRAGNLLAAEGRIAEAIDMYQRSARMGVEGRKPHSVPAARRARVRNVCKRMRELGYADDVLPCLRALAEAGDVYALEGACIWMLEMGKVDEAVAWLLTSTVLDSDRSRHAAANILERAGRHDEALAAYMLSGEAGERADLKRAASIMRGSGRTEEAVTWLYALADLGNPETLSCLGELMEEVGRVEDATALYMRAAEVGDGTKFLRSAKSLLHQAGKHQEEAWLEALGIEPGGIISEPKYWEQS